jgi:DNA ligase-1
VDDWLFEWKYDGIRAQVVKRGGQCWIWSRGEELVTERFPEVAQAVARLPDGTVLDGELLAWRVGETRPASFHLLQQRIGRKTLTKKVLAEAPVVFLAYDLLESGGADLRGEEQQVRSGRLRSLSSLALLPGSSDPEAAAPPAAPLPGLSPLPRAAALGPSPLLRPAALGLSPLLSPASWAEAATWRAAAREQGVEGLMLKQRSARYGSGRTKSGGTWWKWKVEPLSVDAVLVYAQAGHGRRASVYTDYTFALWSRPPRSAAEAQGVVEAIARGEPAPRADADALQLLPFAKAYSGLTDEEFRAVDREIREHTLTTFGPVRSVRPTLVFEIGFEGINASPRHKSGVAVRFPRMLRIRRDKPLHEADSMAVLRGLLPV